MPATGDEQIEYLNTIAAQRDWTVTHSFSDRRATVRKGVDRRPSEAALIEVIRSGMIDKVLIHGVDRIGKSLSALVAFVEACRMAGVSLWLDEQGLDTAGSNGLSMFDLCAMLALHLRQSRRGRILGGQAAARALSIKFGRPPLSRWKLAQAREELAAGKGVRQVARLVGISAASVSRLKNSIDAAAV